jgi:hypothetical protein
MNVVAHCRLVLQEELVRNCLHLQGRDSPNCKNLSDMSNYLCVNNAFYPARIEYFTNNFLYLAFHRGDPGSMPTNSRGICS